FSRHSCPAVLLLLSFRPLQRTCHRSNGGAVEPICPGGARHGSRPAVAASTGIGRRSRTASGSGCAFFFVISRQPFGAGKRLFARARKSDSPAAKRMAKHVSMLPVPLQHAQPGAAGRIWAGPPLSRASPGALRLPGLRKNRFEPLVARHEGP